LHLIFFQVFYLFFILLIKSSFLLFLELEHFLVVFFTEVLIFPGLLLLLAEHVAKIDRAEEEDYHGDHSAAESHHLYFLFFSFRQRLGIFMGLYRKLQLVSLETNYLQPLFKLFVLWIMIDSVAKGQDQHVRYDDNQ
jgi:hypothetical protein